MDQSLRTLTQTQLSTAGLVLVQVADIYMDIFSNPSAKTYIHEPEEAKCITTNVFEKLNSFKK